MRRRVSIKVFQAPPSFITALPQTLNVLSEDPDFGLTCQVSGGTAARDVYPLLVFRLNVIPCVI